MKCLQPHYLLIILFFVLYNNGVIHMLPESGNLTKQGLLNIRYHHDPHFTRYSLRQRDDIKARDVIKDQRPKTSSSNKTLTRNDSLFRTFTTCRCQEGYICDANGRCRVGFS